jgi:hypothetical protein
VRAVRETQTKGMKKIKLSGGNGKCAIVDNEDYPFVSRFRWIYSNKEVFVSLLAGRMKYVEVPAWCLFFTPKSGNYTLYKNKNPLDLRKENLYFGRAPEKNHRRKKQKTQQGVKCSSRYKGVSKKIGHPIKKWSANIGKEGVVYHLGYFKTQWEAAKAYNTKAKELYGEHAYQNKPERSGKK